MPQGGDSPGAAQQHSGGTGAERGKDGGVVPHDHLPGPVAGAQVAEAVLHPCGRMQYCADEHRNAQGMSPVQCTCIL